MHALELLGFDTTVPSFFPSLASLPDFHVLQIGPNSLVNPDQVLSFVNTQPPPVCFLVLGNIYARRGESTDPDDYYDVHLDEDTGEPILPPGWVCPVWRGGWTKEKVEEIAVAAEQNGIKTAGTTFQAGAIEEAFEVEEEKVDTYFEILAEQEAIAWEHRMMLGEANDAEDESEDEEGDEQEDEEGETEEDDEEWEDEE
ncbi:hypothetical protein JCM8547_004864 [Rhodosporidiobolus lusitaniae]